MSYMSSRYLISCNLAKLYRIQCVETSVKITHLFCNPKIQSLQVQLDIDVQVIKL